MRCLHACTGAPAAGHWLAGMGPVWRRWWCAVVEVVAGTNVSAGRPATTTTIEFHFNQSKLNSLTSNMPFSCSPWNSLTHSLTLWISLSLRSPRSLPPLPPPIHSSDRHTKHNNYNGASTTNDDNNNRVEQATSNECQIAIGSGGPHLAPPFFPLHSLPLDDDQFGGCGCGYGPQQYKNSSAPRADSLPESSAHL